MSLAEIIPIVLVILVIVTILKSIKAVPQGMEYTVEQFGRYVRTLKPGLSFIIPYFEAVGYKMNMRERVIDIPSQDVITKDNAMVTGMRWSSSKWLMRVWLPMKSIAWTMRLKTSA